MTQRRNTTEPGIGPEFFLDAASQGHQLRLEIENGQQSPGNIPINACGTKQGTSPIVSESSLAFVFTAEGRVERVTFRGYPINDRALHSLQVGVISMRATGSFLNLRKYLLAHRSTVCDTHKISYQLDFLR